MLSPKIAQQQRADVLDICFRCIIGPPEHHVLKPAPCIVGQAPSGNRTTLTTSPPAAIAVDPHEMACPRRLVRYYRIAGFKAGREVGEDLGSLRDRLTWGAEGTLMDASAEEFMRRWTSLMRETNTGGGEGPGRRPRAQRQ